MYTSIISHMNRQISMKRPDGARTWIGEVIIPDRRSLYARQGITSEKTDLGHLSHATVFVPTQRYQLSF